MKKLFSIIILVFALTACEQGNDPAPTPTSTQSSISNLLIGKWRISYSAVDDNNNDYPDENEREAGDTEVFITFKADGTALLEDITSPADNRTLHWQVNDKKITLTLLDENGNFVPDDNIIHDIISLTTNEMIWRESHGIGGSFLGLIK